MIQDSDSDSNKFRAMGIYPDAEYGIERLPRKAS
jgi:hypothetical protein